MSFAINSTVDEPQSKKRFVVLATLFIGIFVAYLDRVNVSVLAANETFLFDMGIADSPIQIGMLMSFFLFAYGISNIALSPLGDILGPRRAMMICIASWAIAMMVGGMATVFAVMLVSRVILGLGEGFYYPLQSVLTRNWFPKKERGRATATWVIGQSVAPAIAMPFFAFIIAKFGWRESFYVAMVMGLIPLYLLWRHVTDTPAQHKTISISERAHIESDMEDLSSSVDKIPFWARIKPFVKDYRYWLVLFWYVCLQCVGWGLIAWLPKYLRVAREFSWAEMGWLASMPFVVAIFTKAMTGWLVDKVGRCAPLLFAAMFLGSICIYAGAIVENKYLAAVLLSLANGFVTMATPAAWALLQGIVPRTSLATAGGSMNGFSNMISSLSPALIGFFIASYGSYSGGLICLAGIAALACIPAFILMLKKL